MIKFPPLTEARFVERPNRFPVKVDMGGRPVFAHLHDPGRLRELLVPGAKLYLQKTENPDRKTAWDIILPRLQIMAPYKNRVDLSRQVGNPTRPT